MPDGYEAYLINDSKFSADKLDLYIEQMSTVTDEQIKVLFPAYYRKVISCLSNIPLRKYLTDEQVSDLYEFYFKPFVVSLVTHVPMIYFMGQMTEYQPDVVKKIRIGLRTFRLPESVCFRGETIPLRKEPIVTYSEAGDIFRGMRVSREDVNRLALFMAIYCRKRNEKYDEFRALSREHLFMRVPMSVVWSVFFYTLRRLSDYTAVIQLFGNLRKTVRESVARVREYKGTGAEV